MPVMRLRPSRALGRRAAALRAACAAMAWLGVAATGTQAQSTVVPPDAPGFTEYVASQLRQQLGDATVVVREPLTLGIASERTPLDKLYAACQSNRSHCADDVNAFVKTRTQAFRAATIPAGTRGSSITPSRKCGRFSSATSATGWRSSVSTASALMA